MLNNILCTSFEEARRVPVGVLDFYGCAHCGFVWNNAFDENLVCYGSNYENNQSHSSVFKNHLNEVVGEIQSLMAYKPFSVIEVGCGQGYFLDLLESMGGGDQGPGLRSCASRPSGNNAFLVGSRICSVRSCASKHNRSSFIVEPSCD